MPNVTEEFLDLQGLQEYDAKIKEFIGGANSYDTMPSTADLLAMGNNTIFYTEGFYSKADGNGGYYKVTTTYTHGALEIKHDSPKKFLVALGENGQENPAVIDVCRYGVRPLAYNTAIDFNTINATDSFATANSAIMSYIYQPSYGSVYKFPVGRFVFEDTISLSNTQCSICGSGLPQIREANQINSDYLGGTTLYFPFLDNDESGISVSFGNVENLTIVGNLNTYNIVIDRTKTITAPSGVVTETIKQVAGNDVKCTGLNKTANGFIHNVMVMGFYTGIKCSTANIYIDNIYARKCHLGFDIKGDTKCNNVFGWDVYTLLTIGASLTSATNVRVDSCVHALHLVNGNSVTINDLDGDYCTDSLIMIGSPDEWKEVKNCFLSGIHGRCCTLNSYDSTQATAPDVRDLVSTSGYGFIRLYRGAFMGNTVQFTNINGSNPFDGTSNYLTPNIIFTFDGSFSMNASGNFFSVADGGIASITDLQKRFQTKSGVTARIDNFSSIYGVQGTTFTDMTAMISNKVDKVQGKELSTEDAQALTTQQVNDLIAILT